MQKPQIGNTGIAIRPQSVAGYFALAATVERTVKPQPEMNLKMGEFQQKIRKRECNNSQNLFLIRVPGDFIAAQLHQLHQNDQHGDSHQHVD